MTGAVGRDSHQLSVQLDEVAAPHCSPDHLELEPIAAHSAATCCRTHNHSNTTHSSSNRDCTQVKQTVSEGISLLLWVVLQHVSTCHPDDELRCNDSGTVLDDIRRLACLLSISILAVVD